MKKIFTYAVIVGTIFFAGCRDADTQTTPAETPSKNAETMSTVAITIEPSAEVPATSAPPTASEPASTGETSTWTAEEGDPGAENPPYVNIYLVALEDNGESGRAIGCNDSLVAVQAKYGLAKDESTAKDTLTKLFAVKDEFYGQSGLYNALHRSDLKVDSLTADAGKKATLKLSGTLMLGGVCDTPRFEEQIRETVLQFKDLYSDVEIFVNGQPLKELLSEQG